MILELSHCGKSKKLDDLGTVLGILVYFYCFQLGFLKCGPAVEQTGTLGRYFVGPSPQDPTS